MPEERYITFVITRLWGPSKLTWKWPFFDRKWAIPTLLPHVTISFIGEIVSPTEVYICAKYLNHTFLLAWVILKKYFFRFSAGAHFNLSYVPNKIKKKKKVVLRNTQFGPANLTSHHSSKSATTWIGTPYKSFEEFANSLLIIVRIVQKVMKRELKNWYRRGIELPRQPQFCLTDDCSIPRTHI